MCRDKGWLYDIAFDSCSKTDRAYTGFGTP